MSKYTRLGKNTLLVFIGNAGAKLIGLLMLPFYTRWLSVEGYGTTDIISVYATLLLGLATACIADSVFIFPKDQPMEKQRAYFSSGLVFAFLSLLLTALLFKIVTLVFVYKAIENSFTDNTWLIYGLLVTSFVQQYMQQFVRSIDKMKVYSTTGIVLTGCTAVFSFIIIPRWGVFGYVIALILANFSAAVYSFFCSGAFRYFSIKSIQKIYCIEMLKFSIPGIPNVMMWWVVGALNRPLLEKYAGIYSVGIFAVANKFPGILTAFFTIFGLAWQISAIEEFGKDDYVIFYNRVFRIAITGLLLFFFMITIFSKLIISIFTTENFYDAWRYMSILTLGVVFQSISGFAGSTFSAIRQSKYFFYSSIWGGIASLLCNIILIPRFGIIGAAISVLVSFMVMSIFRLGYGWKYVKLKNINIYLVMMIISISAIILQLCITIEILKYGLLICLLALLVWLNLSLKEDVLLLLKKVKEKL